MPISDLYIRNPEDPNYVYGFDANYSTSEFLGNKNLEIGAAFSQSFTENQSDKFNGSRFSNSKKSRSDCKLVT